MAASSSVMMHAIGSGALMQRSTVGGGKLRMTPAPHNVPDANMATKAMGTRAAKRGGG